MCVLCVSVHAGRQHACRSGHYWNYCNYCNYCWNYLSTCRKRSDPSDVGLGLKSRWILEPCVCCVRVLCGGRSSLGPRSTTVGPRRPGVRVWIPAFLESTVGPRHIRDISGSRNPLEGLLGVPAEIATSVDPGGSRGEWGSPCAGRGRRARRGRR